MIRAIITGSLMVFTSAAMAQEFGIELNAGMQGLRYDLNGGNAKIQAGGALGLQYDFRLGKRWQLITGLSGGYYKTKTTLQDGALFSSYAIDAEGSAFEFRVKPTGYEESLQFIAAGIPLMLQYHTTGKTQWYLNGGTKLLFPFSIKAKALATQLKMSGYYPDYNVEMDQLPQHGFGSTNNWEHTAKPKLKPTATLSAATGFSFPLTNGLRLYTGVYIDYGLTEMRELTDGSLPLVNHQPTGISNVTGNGMLHKAGETKLLAYGLQLKLGLVKKKKNTTPAPAPVAEIIPPVKAAPAPELVKAEEKPAPLPVIDTVISIPAPASITKEEEQVMEKPVVFATIGKTSLPESVKSHLDSVAGILQKYPDLQVAIVGHTCDIGTEKENDKIGIARAKSAAVYLQQKGIPENRMTTISAGPSLPLVPNHSNGNRSVNRRVTIRIH